MGKRIFFAVINAHVNLSKLERSLTMKDGKKVISVLLVLVFVLQLFPVPAAKTMSDKFSAEIQPEDYMSQIVTESENTVEAEILPTVIDRIEETETAAVTSTSSETTTYESPELEFIGAPYLYNYNDNEKYSAFSGALIYECVDYVLPGINGLDVVIGRRYNSQTANTDFSSLEATIDEATGEVIYRSNNIYNDDLEYYTGLGHGWDFLFSRMGYSGNYIHLSDGRSYEYKYHSPQKDYKTGEIIREAYYEIIDCPPDELVLAKDNTFSNGVNTSSFCLTYADGKREYFYGKNLIGIQDRYGNTITLVHERVNSLPQITITDTLGRVIVISCQEISNNEDLITVSLPGNLSFNYSIAKQKYGGWRAIASYTDTTGRTTRYSYLWESIDIDYEIDENSVGYCSYMNLYAITHPTGAQTRYTFEKVRRYGKGSTDRTELFVLAARADIVGQEMSNRTDYTYTKYSGATYDQDSIYITAEISTGPGITKVLNFNRNKQLLNAEIKQENVLLQNTVYAYDDYDLPILETTSTYSPDNQTTPMVSVVAREHDSKGNVTAEWSTLADGDSTDTEYKTTYTYDSTYNLLLTKTWKQDADTTICLENTLSADKKQIIRTDVYRNDVLAARTDYSYDAYGNISSEKRYHDDWTTYDLTEYAYSSNAYLSQEKHTGVLAADGTAAEGTPGQTAGTVVTSYIYDSIGRLTSLTDGMGHTTAYTYDAAGNVTQITDPDSSTVTYLRDYGGNTVTVTDENGAQVKYTYTPLGLEFETVDVQSGYVLTRREYDEHSRLSRVTDFVYGAVTTYTYDALGRVLSETVTQDDTVLAQTLYAYDDAVENGLYNKVTKTVVGDSNAPSVVTTQYTDAHGNTVKTGMVLDGTEYFDTYTYDYLGNPLTQLSAADAGKNLPFTVKYGYNESSQVVQTWNSLNQCAANTYDALGRLVESTDYTGTPTTYTYDSLGRLLTQSVTVETGVTAVSKYDYDAAGNIIREWTPTNAVGETAAWSKTAYSYDSRGRLTQTVQYDGETAALTTAYTYDAAGNTLSMTAGGKTTTYTYDRFGNVLTMMDAMGQQETYAYSALGRPVSKTTRSGVTITYCYDALGRLTGTVAQDGDVLDAVCYSYTLTGQLLSESSNWQRTEYRYDELGRNITILETQTDVEGTAPDVGPGTDPEQQPETPPVLDPDAVILTFYPNGGTVTPTYADISEWETYDLPTPTRPGYIFKGWYLVEQLDIEEFVSQENWQNSCTAIRDGRNVEITASSTIVAAWEPISYTIEYNKNYSFSITNFYPQECIYDEPVILRDESMFRFNYTQIGWSPDPDGSTVYSLGETVRNLTTEAGSTVVLYAVWEKGGMFDSNATDTVSPMSVSNEAQTGAELLTCEKTFTYDLAGNRSTMTVTRGQTTVQSVTYAYDNLNRLTAVSEDGIQQAAYTYDTNGNRASLTYANGVTETYTYNLANWITGLTNAKDGQTLSSFAYTYYASGSQKSETDHTGKVTSYTYDGLNRLTQETATGSDTVSYTYDAAGNRSTMTVGETVTTYTYDANNRLTQTVEGETVTDYTYDANGNTLSKVCGLSTTTYTYNGLDQQLTATVNGATTSYAYNAQGIRTAKETGTTRTDYLLDGGNVIGEVENGTISAQYLRGFNLISREAETTEYYLFNAHGDVVNLTDSAGTVTKSYDYDAFGNEIAPDSADENPFRYCGEYWDVETATYYLRARYYAPSIGRFTQADSVRYSMRTLPGGAKVADPLSLNLYTYCANNPVLFFDPSGNAWDIIFDIFSAVWSLNDFIKDPTWLNFGYLAWDVGGALIPLVPGSYAAKGAKAISKLDDVSDIARLFGKTDDAVDAAKVGKSIANSKILRRNLIAAGKVAPDYAHAAHHIVAGGAKDADIARAILERFGIGINDAVNGVFLPTIKGASDAAYHPGIHTKAYYEKVNELLRQAMTKEDVVNILNMIAAELEAGTFLS